MFIHINYQNQNLEIATGVISLISWSDMSISPTYGLKNHSLSFIMKNDFMKGSENK